ncbi:DNA-directed RNA polymerase subunit N [Candidatus Burarchaeum australiense]|nr:DNA-directed RNA polymerase subunit N [Candidatus Burarchaeum australiense]
MLAVSTAIPQCGVSGMLFPVRCFTCGSVIGDRYEEYVELLKKNKPGATLDKMGIKRYCCRRMFLSHIDLVGEVTKYMRF